MRGFYGLMDQYSSAQNSKQTLRAMKQNARNGYWNGARPPDGYRVVVAAKIAASVLAGAAGLAFSAYRAGRRAGFKALEEQEQCRSNWRALIFELVARLKGIEPLTPDLEGPCSIQLSYRRFVKALNEL